MRLLGDENFRREILEGLHARIPAAVVIEAQGAGLLTTPYPDVLAWAAVHDHIVLPHDLKTLVPDAWARVAQGLPMPGVAFVPWEFPVGLAVMILTELLRAEPEQFVNNVLYISNFVPR